MSDFNYRETFGSAMSKGDLESTLTSLELLKDAPLAVYNAKEEYQKRMKDTRRNSDNTRLSNTIVTSSSIPSNISESEIHDPRIVDYETEDSIDLYERHKLAYLEYETKVEFLRSLIADADDEDQEGSNEDKDGKINKRSAYDIISEMYTIQYNAELESQNATEKASLERMFQDAKSIQENGVDEARQLVQSLEEITKMEEETETMIQDMLKMESEIASLETQNEIKKSEIEKQIETEIEEIRQMESQKHPDDSYLVLDGFEKLKQATRENELQVLQMKKITTTNLQDNQSTFISLPSLESDLVSQQKLNKKLERSIFNFKQEQERIEQQLSKQTSHILDMNKFKQSGNSSLPMTKKEKTIEWFSTFIPLLGNLAGIDSDNIKISCRGPHTSSVKFTKTLATKAGFSVSKIDILFELVIENLTERLQAAHIVDVISHETQSQHWDTTDSTKSILRPEQRSTLATSLFEKTIKVGNAMPAYFVGSVSQKVLEMIEM